MATGFNQCQPIAINEGGADQAVKRFLDNDPYYPRPATGSADDSLWLHFQQRYIVASRKITDGSGHCDLPSLFIEKLQKAMTARLEKKAEAARRSDIWSDFESQADDYNK